ncbi:helix-turn-helix domain-containing protein [Alicyclobacillus ferrooxydans]|uniref:HTH cro/C1-type domain-containing protein n=1 Tax=Alicyclobacillus ferrooxydans TaxID=471514 RepID=A0A0P9CYJ6_9BACL|nr:helix-turn-helix transcriptional regulator [Alicyclobacillus ferrooxydans]KPV41995.1 hypothetical protein AN477_19695 [Alicyclobacillus ferrooxydans]
MSIARAVKIARKQRRLQQDELGVPYSKSMVSMMERGERLPAVDVAPLIGQKLDHPAAYLELARELSGGYGPSWLDGPNVDLHRASVRERTLDEVQEAILNIERFPASRPPNVETDGERKRRYEHLLQCFDALVALTAYIGVQCLEYGFSMLQLSKDHHAKLKGKRYVT